MASRIVIRLRSLGAAAALTLAVRGAGADPAADAAAARALFEQGKAQLELGNWERACARFDESLALQINVSTSVKVARCRAHEGKLATAAQEYERARTLLQDPSNAGRRGELATVIEKELGEIAPRVPRLRVIVEDAPAGLVISANDAPIPAGSVGEAFPVDPGAYQVTAEAPGFRPEVKTATVEAATAPGQIIEVRIRLTPEAQPERTPLAAEPAAASVPPPAAPPGASGEAPAAASAVPPSPGFGERPHRDRASTAGLGYALGGIGLGALGAGAVLGVLTLERVHESDSYCTYPGGTCDGRGIELRKEAAQLQTAGIVAASVGGALVATGVTLVVRDAGRSGKASLSLSLDASSIHGCVRW